MLDPLSEAQDQFKTLFEEALAGMLLVDDRVRIVEANQAACAALGRTREALLGEDGRHFARPDPGVDIDEAFRVFLETGYTEGRIHVARPDGTRRLIHYRGHAHIRPGLHLYTIEDLTERSGAEELLNAENEILERIARREPLAQVLVAAVGFVETHVRGARAIVCLLDESVNVFRCEAPTLPQVLRDVLAEYPADPGASVCGKAVATRKRVVVTEVKGSDLPPDAVQLLLANGFLAAWATPLLTPDGRPLGSLTTFLGEPRAPEEKEARLLDTAAELLSLAVERQAQEAALDLRTHALETASSGIVFTDPRRPDNPIVWVNPAFLKMTGYSSEEVLGRNPRFLQGPETDAKAVLAIHEAMTRGEAIRTVLLNYHKDGTTFWNQLAISPVRDGAGRIVTWIGIQNDVTLLKEHEASLQKERDFTSAVIQTAGSLVAVYDRDGRIVRFNRSCQSATGFSDLEVRLKPVWEVLVPPEDRERWHQLFASGFDAFPKSTESVWTTRDGRRRLVSWTNVPLAERSSPARYLIATGVDVTEQRAAEAALRESEERYRQLALEREASERRYRTLFERSLAGVYQSTTDGRLLDCNDAFARILGFTSRAEAMKEDAHTFYRSREERASIVERARVQGFLQNYEIAMLRRDGKPVWVLENKSFLEGSDVQPEMMLGTLVDITDIKRAEEELQRLAYHDPLTSLPNRWLFDDRLEVALRQARYQRQPVAVVFLDLDRFKLVNDSLGHRMGDVLLKSVSERLVSCVYEGDTVARLGGDEFLILLPRIAAADDVIRVVLKVQEALRRPFHLDGREVFVTASMGVTIFPLDGEDPDALVKNADTAMYRAKQNGRDGYQLYAPEMNARAVERIHLESELHRALEREELVLHYQPLVDLATGRVYGAEALMRWRHPARRLVPPNDFIPLAEESGLITPIGAWALRTACRQALLWWQSGRALRVAVNLSARQFHDAHLVQQVASILAETGLPPENLQLEITESLAMSDAEETIAMLRALSGLGVDVLLDDFGTGFSSLAYLKRFPLAGLKIDRSFIQDVTSSRHDLAISKAAVDVAEGLGLRTVAEGVETREQVELLRQLGCRAIQGYVVSPAVPPERFEDFLSSPVL